eukprot:6478262-Amphidinium_carterae.4
MALAAPCGEVKSGDPACAVWMAAGTWLSLDAGTASRRSKRELSPSTRRVSCCSGTVSASSTGAAFLLAAGFALAFALPRPVGGGVPTLSRALLSPLLRAAACLAPGMGDKPRSACPRLGALFPRPPSSEPTGVPGAAPKPDMLLPAPSPRLMRRPRRGDQLRKSMTSSTLPLDRLLQDGWRLPDPARSGPMSRSMKLGLEASLLAAP